MSAGNAAGYHRFFDQRLIPHALALVFSAWDQLAWQDRAALEPQITRELAKRLQRLKQARRLPFTVECENDPLTDLPVRLDFRLLSGFDERAYFTLEAKRLYIPRDRRPDPNLDKYRKTGMLAFIEGSYAPNLPDGAMLGYVMDGNLTRAVERLREMLLDEVHRKSLNITSGPSASRYLPGHPQVSETTHRRRPDVPGRMTIVLQHLLVAV